MSDFVTIRVQVRDASGDGRVVEVDHTVPREVFRQPWSFDAMHKVVADGMSKALHDFLHPKKPIPVKQEQSCG